MTVKLSGQDISTWNGQMNFQKSVVAGSHFTFIRVGSIDNTNGICYKDYQFDRNMAAVKNVLPWGGYWYFRPNWDANTQAVYFSNLLKPYEFQLPPVIDVEADPSTWNGKSISPNVHADMIAQFIFRVTKNLSLPKIIIYTRSTYWNIYVEARAGWKNQDLWIARYANLDHPWGDGKYKIRDWDDYKFWQYTSNGNGLAYGNGPTSNGATSKDIDLDWFNGDQNAFNVYIGKEKELSQQEYWMEDIDTWARTQGYSGTKPFGG